MSLIFKDYIVIKDAQPVKEKEETLVLLVSEGEDKLQYKRAFNTNLL